MNCGSTCGSARRTRAVADHLPRPGRVGRRTPRPRASVAAPMKRRAVRPRQLREQLVLLAPPTARRTIGRTAATRRRVERREARARAPATFARDRRPHAPRATSTIPLPVAPGYSSAGISRSNTAATRSRDRRGGSTRPSCRTRRLRGCASSRSTGSRCRSSGSARGSSARRTGATAREYADVEAGRILERALDLGVNVIDTAEIYGRGNSERIVGKALGDRRKEAFVATKVFPIAPTAGYVEKHGRKSAERLGIDVIDLYQIHWPNPVVPIAQQMEGMRRLQQAGVVTDVGVSNFSLDALARRRRRARLAGALEPGAVQPRRAQARRRARALRAGERPPRDRVQPARHGAAVGPLRRRPTRRRVRRGSTTRCSFPRTSTAPRR